MNTGRFILFVVVVTPFLGACSIAIPQPDLRQIETFASIPGTIHLRSDEAFEGSIFHTDVKHRQQICLNSYDVYPDKSSKRSRTSYSCRYEDVFRTVDVDVGNSSRVVFREGLAKIFDHVAVEGESREVPPHAIHVLPAILDLAGHHGCVDEWWLGVIRTKHECACRVSLQYGVQMMNHEGTTDELASEVIKVEKRMEFQPKDVLMLPFYLIRWVSGKDERYTSCYSDAFAEAEAQAFASLVAKFYDSPILPVNGSSTVSEETIGLWKAVAESPQAQLGRLVRALLNKFPEGAARRIIIGSIQAPETDPAVQVFAGFARREVEKRLLAMPHHAVIPMSSLQWTLFQMKLDVKDLGDLAHAREVGTQTGADTIVLGTVAAEGQRMNVTLSVIDIASGSVVASEEGQIGRNPSFQKLMKSTKSPVDEN